MTWRAAGGLALAVVTYLVAAAAPTATISLLVLAVVLVPLGVVIAMRVEPALILSLVLAGTLLSGYAGLVGLPISPDRPLFALALGIVIGGGPVGRGTRPRLRWRAVHSWQLLTVGVVVVLGVASDAFTSQLAQFALLDRLGIVPFITFAIAPLAFSTVRQRGYLVIALVAIGWYIGLTGLLEGFGFKHLAWPRYINDPSVGLHYERARGPFAESTAMGVSLLGCLVGAVIAIQTWHSALARRLAKLLIPVLLLAVIFTLTRAAWLAAAAAVLVGILAEPRVRKYFLPLVAAGLVAVLAALAFIPGLSDSVSERRSEQIAVWDRLNTNAAAFEAFEQNPLTGVGWASFARNSDPYLRQHPDYPLTGQDIEVHNVLLSRLAEIGLLGTVPLLVALVLGVLVPAFAPTTPELRPWRTGLLMYGTAYSVMAMFGPTTAAFPNLLLWLLAGIVAAPRLVHGPTTGATPVPAAARPVEVAT